MPTRSYGRSDLGRVKRIDPFDVDVGKITQFARTAFDRQLERETRERERLKKIKIETSEKFQRYLERQASDDNNVVQDDGESNVQTSSRHESSSPRRPVVNVKKKTKKKAPPTRSNRAEQSPLRSRRLVCGTAINKRRASTHSFQLSPKELGGLKLEPMSKSYNSVQQGRASSSASTSTSDGSALYFQVQYDYEPQMPGDLKLEKNQIVRVLSKDQCEDGWWHGCNIVNGMYGVFPSNFVTPLTSETYVPSSQVIRSSSERSPRFHPPGSPTLSPRSKSWRANTLRSNGGSSSSILSTRSRSWRSPTSIASPTFLEPLSPCSPTSPLSPDDKGYRTFLQSPKPPVQKPKISQKIKSKPAIDINNNNTMELIEQALMQEEEERNRAAETIQGVYRRRSSSKRLFEDDGAFTRREIPGISRAGTDLSITSILSTEEGHALESAASVLQTHFRRFKKDKELNQAAVTLQKHFRNINNKKKQETELPEDVKHAVVKIQTHLRKYQVKRQLKQETEAAVTIQTHLRRRLSRRIDGKTEVVEENKQDEDLMHAAAVIQSHFRRFRNQVSFVSSVTSATDSSSEEEDEEYHERCKSLRRSFSKCVIPMNRGDSLTDFHEEANSQAARKALISRLGSKLVTDTISIGLLLLTKVDIPSLSVNVTVREMFSMLSSKQSKVIVKGLIAIRKSLEQEKPNFLRALIKCGVVKQVLSLSNHGDTEIQIEALWTLSNLAATACADEIIIQGGVKQICSLLSSDNEQVYSQACWTAGNIAAWSIEARTMMLESSALTLMIGNLSKANSSSFEQTCIWALSNLVRGNPAPEPHLVKELVSVVCNCVFSNENNLGLLIEAVWCLSYLSEGSEEVRQSIAEHGAISFLVKLIEDHKWGNRKLLLACLRTLGNLLSSPNPQLVLAAFAEGILALILQLGSQGETPLLKEVLWVMGNIMSGSVTQLDFVLKYRECFALIVSSLDSVSPNILYEALFALNNFVLDASPVQVRKLLLSYKTIPEKWLAILTRKPEKEVVLLCIESIGTTATKLAAFRGEFKEMLQLKEPLSRALSAYTDPNIVNQSRNLRALLTSKKKKKKKDNE